jgi:hypothetical protein
MLNRLRRHTPARDFDFSGEDETSELTEEATQEKTGRRRNGAPGFVVFGREFSTRQDNGRIMRMAAHRRQPKL